MQHPQYSICGKTKGGRHQMGLTPYPPPPTNRALSTHLCWASVEFVSLIFIACRKSTRMIRVSADIHDTDDNNTDTCSDLNNVYKWEIGAIGTALDFCKESSIFEVETKPNTNRKWKLKMHFKSTSDKVQLQILSCNDGIVHVTSEFLVLSEDYNNNTPSRFSRNSQASQDQEPVQLLMRGWNSQVQLW